MIIASTTPRESKYLLEHLLDLVLNLVSVVRVSFRKSVKGGQITASRHQGGAGRIVHYIRLLRFMYVHCLKLKTTFTHSFIHNFNIFIHFSLI